MKIDFTDVFFWPIFGDKKSLPARAKVALFLSPFRRRRSSDYASKHVEMMKVFKLERPADSEQISRFLTHAVFRENQASFERASTRPPKPMSIGNG
jgi:hypothetical protein